MDFTQAKYVSIIEAALGAGYRVCSIRDWYDDPVKQGRVLLVRHDVDRQPWNALEMARNEHARGVRTSYYFRSLPCSFVPEVITGIRDLGHEIGYHYEDWSLARFDKARAIEMFDTNLKRLREFAPVSSIAMHGSPLSRESNLSIWKHCDFRDWGVIDAIESLDFKGFASFTDAGRTFGQTGANLRDYLRGEDRIDDVHSSDDLAAFLRTGRYERVHIGVHPERWNDSALPWARQWAFDFAANSVKRGLKLVRKAPAQTGPG
jgi:hypothetical protein